MSKKNLILCTIIFLGILARPSWGMQWCCGEEEKDEETKHLTHTRQATQPVYGQLPDLTEHKRLHQEKQKLEEEKQRLAQEEEKITQQEKNLYEQTPQILNMQEQETKPQQSRQETQLVRFGTTTLMLPQKFKLLPVNDGSGSLSYTVPRICYIQIFPDYRNALDNSKHVQDLSGLQIIGQQDRIQDLMKEICGYIQSRNKETPEQRVPLFIQTLEAIVKEALAKGTLQLRMEKNSTLQKTRLVLEWTSPEQEKMPAFLVTVPKYKDEKKK